MRKTRLLPLELHHRTKRSIAFSAALTACGVVLALTAATSQAGAQAPTKRQIYVTVTDPQARLVTGLDSSHFQVVERGVPRAITGFSGGSYPIAVAVVGSEPIVDPAALRLGDVLIQTRSLSGATRQLDAFGLDRKVIVAASQVQTPMLPAGIEFIQTDSAGLQKTILRLRNQYRLDFDSESPSADIEVVMAKPVGMPPLTASWN